MAQSRNHFFTPYLCTPRVCLLLPKVQQSTAKAGKYRLIQRALVLGVALLWCYSIPTGYKVMPKTRLICTYHGGDIAYRKTPSAYLTML